MPLLPLLDRIESRFATANAIKWTDEHWAIPLSASAAYLLLVFAGPRWMQNRPAYSLRVPMTIWSTGLAAFSLLGFMTLMPTLLEALITGGVQHSVCSNSAMSQSHTALWIFLFILSKIAEFGDTVFIVLRKSPLTFLHWYHHITVMLYSWNGYSNWGAVGLWFAIMNLLAHTVMYSYYAAKASGHKLPASIAQCITILQLSQFFMGIICNVLAFWLKKRPGGGDCDMDDRKFTGAMVIYGSYSILFLNFFYHRYIKKSTIPKKTSP